jgi:tRNA(Arg) A34 adenosine deaminase TadA
VRIRVNNNQPMTFPVAITFPIHLFIISSATSTMEDPTAGPTFLEIRPPEVVSSPVPTLVEAYVAIVEPKQCGSLVKQLSRDLPLTQKTIDLSHLRRVKRTLLPSTNAERRPETDVEEVESKSQDVDIQQPSKKRQRTTNESVHLEVLLGGVHVIDQIILEKGDSCAPAKLLNELKILQMHVPARPPESELDWKEFHARWPTTFFPNKTREYREKEMQLSLDEIHQMRRGMEEAIADSLSGESKRALNGAVVMSPETGCVIARASNERDVQLPSIYEQNPLATYILLALQGVSRRERELAIEKGMDSDTFQKGQYLCTGYDIYTTMEPTVFEAMALAHARVRRVVYGSSSPTSLGGISDMSVHALPGTNHHYRTFTCRVDTDLWKQCQGSHQA